MRKLVNYHPLKLNLGYDSEGGKVPPLFV